MKKIIIIGGGAAGLMAAVNAADSSHKENCEIKEVISSIENVPVFSEKKVVYLDNIDIFKKDATFRDGLLNAILDLPNYTILIIKENKTDEKTKLGKEIKSKGAIIKCDYPDDSTMKAF